ncbi:multiple epidermal growth factor-like domains protein 11 [Ostrea edulis]|uniref:multiple epidermal growth factor-like domains protein 11 n=1 Tax=Ostrea edulis TaxID=37623 RepID=UPI0024AEFF0F|nr:multiple epidermal growth factor-like domains protein 11 [Ostrea edulis]
MILILLQFMLFVIYTGAFENLALGKPAWEENIWPGKETEWGAAKAVDGQYSDREALGNQCTISVGDQTTATLRVDLESVVSISMINIYYRTDNFPSPGAFYDRFAGFFLYVSNTTSKDDGHLCFHEIQNVNGTPSEDQRIKCYVHGRYVIFYNERRPGVNYPSYYSQYAFADVCELEVYGCHNPNYYGDNCDQVCSEGCPEKKCDAITGNCLNCLPGYQGLRCDQVCDQHKYGQHCPLQCGNCSDGETCHHVNGTCLNGCDVGVEGDKCQTHCQPGFYGKNCGQRCSHNCNVTNRCDRFTGECDGGCKPGWKPPNCQEVCPRGYFGINCENSCTTYCGRNGTCDRITGVCDGGCAEGWSGPLCGTVSKVSDWSEWTACSATCGDNGVRHRFRTSMGVCIHIAINETGKCGDQQCPIDGSWGAWGGYSTCDKSCGGGWKLRFRACSSPPPSHGGQPCYGDSVQPTGCAMVHCPIDGGWSTWSDFGQCSETCGQGVQIKSRTCTKPIPRYGGQDCIGLANAFKSCQRGECPVNGNWGEWGHTRPCDMSCGGGLQLRLRECNNPPPSHGGIPCPGQSVHAVSCNTDQCPDQIKGTQSSNQLIG